MQKTCTKCDTEYPATTEFFFKEKKGRYGLRSKCKTCFYAESLKQKQKPEAKEKSRAARKKHYHENKETYAKRWKQYYAANAEHLRTKAKEYGKNNRPNLRIKERKRREDPGFRLGSAISRGMRQSLGQNKKRGAHWEDLVGYTRDELKRHLSELFEPGMSFENYGEWHIDHRTPKAVFNYSKPEHEDFRRCWSLDNLQPMWASENQSKRDKIDKPFQPSLALG